MNEMEDLSLEGLCASGRTADVATGAFRRGIPCLRKARFLMQNHRHLKYYYNKSNSALCYKQFNIN